MFEAHVYNEQDSAAVEFSDPILTAGQHYRCWHPLYQCNVRVWLAAGKRQNNNQHFLYVEYRNRDNSHGYRSVEIPQQALRRSALQELLSNLPLSRELDPTRTERWS
ncbi:MAG: hypothetical protein OIF55_06550 [Amphritea sp.]|nr:hypothetical protein [Amphritea sp.]